MSDGPGKVIQLHKPHRTARDAALGDELAAVREALEDLSREIRSRFPVDHRTDEDDGGLGPLGASGDESIAAGEVCEGEDEHGDEAEDPDVEAGQGIDWLALFEELRSRINSFGMSEHEGEVDAFGMDSSALASTAGLFEFLRTRYWRVETSGLEHVPREAPVLFVANRSGVLPYDGLMLAQVLERERPEWPRARFLVADWLASLPFLQPRLTRVGGVRACRENIDRLLGGGHPVLAFPEGEKGAAKPFQDRYRVQRFARGGVVRAAFANDVPLVPVGIVGAEEAHPILWKTRLPAKWLGLPFLPVTPTFPLLGPLGLLPLPTKWRIHFGEPLSLAELRDAGSGSSDDELGIWELNENLRDRIAALIDDGLDARESVWE